MFVKNTYHTTYCTNIHPGQNWEATWESLREHLPFIKERVAEGAAFGVGLRLSNKASEELGTGQQLAEFKQWLDEQGLYVFTMNGFPFGDFHGQRVKDLVHAPDWSSPERLRYTKRLFEQLAFLLPEGQHGGISTSPVSYKHWHTYPGLERKSLEEGARQMASLILYLHQIEKEQGKYLHLDIEPEPDGLIENSSELVGFFKDQLEVIAQPILQKHLSIGAEAARRLIYRHITACYDICHFSLAYEKPEDTFRKFREAGITVGKIQVSAALKILFGEGAKEALWDSLARFDEPVYLHQVTELRGGKVHTYTDLPEVLARKGAHEELRAHFHVPIFLERFEHLHSTQDQILAVLEYLKTHEVTQHLEVETYTWDVLPPALKKPLKESITRELQWLKDRL